MAKLRKPQEQLPILASNGVETKINDLNEKCGRYGSYYKLQTKAKKRNR